PCDPAAMAAQSPQICPAHTGFQLTLPGNPFLAHHVVRETEAVAKTTASSFSGPCAAYPTAPAGSDCAPNLLKYTAQKGGNMVEKLIRAYYNAYNAADAEGLKRLLHPEVVLVSALGTQAGRDAYLATYAFMTGHFEDRMEPQSKIGRASCRARGETSGGP